MPLAMSPGSQISQVCQPGVLGVSSVSWSISFLCLFRRGVEGAMSRVLPHCPRREHCRSYSHEAYQSQAIDLCDYVGFGVVLSDGRVRTHGVSDRGNEG